MKENPDIFDHFFTRLRRRRVFKILWNVLKRVALFLVFLVFFLWFFLQSEQVQNWAVQKVTTYLEKEFDTRVQVERVDLDFFDKVVLEGLFIEDRNGDTLLYSKTLKASLSADLLSILQSNLDIDDVYLEDALFIIKRDSAAVEDNLQFFIKKFSRPPDTINQKPAKPFFLDIDNVFLTDIRFIKDDVVSGQKISVDLESGHINVKNLDLPQKIIDIGSVKLQQPVITMLERPKYPHPPLENPVDILSLPDSIVQNNLVIKVEDFNLKEGVFELHNFRKSPIKTSPADELDFTHLRVYDINVDIDTFSYTEDNYIGEVNGISFKDGSGFVLNELSAKHAHVSDRKMELFDMQLITPYSHLKDTLVFKYRQFADFKSFPEKVLMQGYFDRSKVAVRDIMVFAKGLKRNVFFSNNKNEIFSIDGLVQGRVNSLRGSDLTIKLGSSTRFRGSFTSKNLNVKNEEYLGLDLELLQTDMKTLRLLIPNFNPPENFDKLGRIDFSGKFDGFFIDFVANGDLKTELGQAIMDMRMDLRGGREAAEYSGGLSLIDFDLLQWTDNKNLGKITFSSEVKEGKGLTSETVTTKVGGRIEHFTYKGYRYENITLDGFLEKNLFDGKLNIQDDNIDFVFDGSIDFVDSIPEFDFKAKINQLNLKQLNLIKDDIALSGEVDLQIIDMNLSNIQGDANLRNIEIIKNGNENYIIDSLTINTHYTKNNKRALAINSEILNVSLNGDFDIPEVPQTILFYAEKNYPELAERFDIKSKFDSISATQFYFDLQIWDSKNFTHLIEPKLDTLRNIKAAGYFDTVNDSIYLDLSIPEVVFDKKYEFIDIILYLEGKEDFTDLEFEIYHSNIDGQFFEPLTLYGELVKDTLIFQLVSTNFTSIFDDLDLNGQIFLTNDYTYEVNFFPSNLVILKQQWKIDKNNFVRFGKQFVETNNFELTNKEKRIVLRSLSDKSVKLGLENISLELIDEWWDYDKLDFAGLINLELVASDIFKLEGLKLSGMADTLEVNGDDWGVLRMDAEMESLKKPTNVYLSITKGTEQLTLEGTVAPVKRRSGVALKDELDFTVDISNYPLHIAEYWIGNVISGTIGRFDSKLKLNGQLKRPNISGSIRIFDAALSIDYLNTRYRIDEGYASVSNTMFDATGSIIRDSLGNQALVRGGIVHDHLKNFRLDVEASAPKFLFLNTSKSDNELYYGTGIGSGTARFSGPFNKIDIDINAKTGPGTRLVIPVSYGTDASEVSFITYIEEEDGEELDDFNNTELRGLQVAMNLEMTQDAEVLLIFDERAGDIIKGRGEGQIQFSVSRLGDIAMYGTYVIEEGDYLFTLLNVVNKPFTVQRGGTIRWEGDPYNAIINLEAEYEGLRTSIYNFISEYLDRSVNENNDLKAEARTAHDVDLLMKLKGPLLQPNITFDIDFPELDGELKNFADSKLRIIRQDQAELNRQVFGLLVVGGFLPSSSSGGFSGREGLIPINTLTELLSNQLSIYLTQLLSDVFTDIGFISGVDFNIDYKLYEADEITAGNERIIRSGSELALNWKNNLFNDRLSIKLGGNIDWGGNVTGSTDGAFLAGDVVIEYALKNDRRFKVRFYQLTDQTLDGRRNKTGIGFSYRTEFDTFGEFLKGMKKTAKKTVDD